MERAPEDGRESPKIDVRTLPESVARLWETMLRLDPSWDLSSWLDEKALEELELVESHLGRESCLLYTSPSPRDLSTSRMPSSA